MIPSGWELVLVVVVIMVLFGYKRLPDATRSLGQSLRIFKSEAKGLRDEPAEAPRPPMTGPPVAGPPSAPGAGGTGTPAPPDAGGRPPAP